MRNGKRIKVLIVDDSAVVRKILTEIIKNDPDLEPVGTAIDPYVARRKLLELEPDVMTLDVEMPKMDGITFLKRIMEYKPIPTIVISSLTERGSDTYLKALEAGAVAVLEKPRLEVGGQLLSSSKDIIEKIKLAAQANLVRSKVSPSVGTKSRLTPLVLAKTTHRIMAIASSTGGTEALKSFLTGLPASIPGTVIVQHMPPMFTKAYAARLNELCPFEVKEAESGDRIIPGRVLLAPGNFHMEIVRSGAFYHVKLNQDPPEHSVRPAADVLMRSVAAYAGANAIGIVFTGMGKDGAEGLRQMRAAGAFTIAQDEKSCVVFGMPKAAIEAGAICKVVPLDRIADEVLRHLNASAVGVAV